MLQNSEGQWVEKKEDLVAMILAFFKNIFQEENNNSPTYQIRWRYLSLTKD